MKISHSMWKDNEHIYEKIVAHPFNQQLIEGTLDTEIFAYYIEQDSLYLHAFSKALALIATKIDGIEDYIHILNNALNTTELERNVVHNHFRKKFNIQNSTRITTATLGYIHHLLATAHQKPFEVGLASILPCFWIYHELGLYTAPRITQDNTYKTWVDTYSGPELHDAVHTLIDMLDYYAENTTIAIRDNMKHIFSQSCIWEYRFWDCVYKLEQFSDI
ncbi:MAG: TenA family protein [Desulfovibrionaceae bacterium]|nr:TenA family protein [Desulfovibrionaceae bacterium]